MAGDIDQKQSEANAASASLSRDTCLLLKPPKKWTLEHLQIARVQQEKVSLDKIVDLKFVPHDDDPEFQRLESLLCDPSMESRDKDDLPFEQDPFKFFFGTLRSYGGWCDSIEDARGENFVNHVIRMILREMYPDLTLYATSYMRLGIDLPFMKPRRKQWVDGCISRFWKDEGLFGVPLALISVSCLLLRYHSWSETSADHTRVWRYWNGKIRDPTNFDAGEHGLQPKSKPGGILRIHNQH
ncbi:hypothetical protein AWENTII_002251 [Aspergillus wentii]